MKNYTKNTIWLIFSLFPFIYGCNEDFLEEKPSTALQQPHTIADFEQLLSNTDVFNQTSSLVLAASDEYEIPTYEAYLALTQLTARNSYIWEKDLYGGQVNVEQWNLPYTAVFYTNSVLEGLQTSNDIGTTDWNKIKGWALFSRAYAFYDLAQNFCETYDSDTAGSTLGIPIRLTPGIDEIVQRSTLQETYDQILSDLTQAGDLLDNDISEAFRYQPSKAAVYAFLARVYLSMGLYVEAENYADRCLDTYNTLIDYNTISKTASTPFRDYNAENIYYSEQTNNLTAVSASLSSAKYTVTPSVLSMYDSNDLRRSLYFSLVASGNTIRKRSYSGRGLLFTGLATDEVYLVKAECAARRSDYPVALETLNTLLVNRYTTGTFTPLTVENTPDVLATVLEERQKELVFRGLRWSDLKRYNKEGANITLTRVLNGETYTLAPNDPRYVFPIPSDEISYSGIEQNPR